jgi:hypothetical protein
MQKMQKLSTEMSGLLWKFVALGEEHKLKVRENWFLSKMSEPKNRSN